MARAAAEMARNMVAKVIGMPHTTDPAFAHLILQPMADQAKEIMFTCSTSFVAGFVEGDQVNVTYLSNNLLAGLLRLVAASAIDDRGIPVLIRPVKNRPERKTA